MVRLRASSSEGEVLAMIYSKTTRASRRKAAKNPAVHATFQGYVAKSARERLAKLAKKPGKVAKRKAARKAAMIAAAEARGREVRAKRIANRPGTPLPDVDAP